MTWRIVLKKSVAKDLKPLPRQDVRRILDTIESLSVDPRRPGAEKLSASERYRIRQGHYRILYEIIDDQVVVVVVKVGHRKDVYR